MIRCIEIVSLSRGILGEEFVKHEKIIGEKRLKELGIKVKYADNALKGMDYLDKHPEARALDLINAFKDEEVDMILCAIGGDDTYRLLPYLFENDELKNAVRNKIFLGFSDTTFNHLMLHKVGLNTFYGQAFLPDICEIGKDMLVYSRSYFEELITTGTISKIKPSKYWYTNREDYSIKAIGKELISHKNEGYKLLQGSSVFEGKILGGCIDSIYDIFSNERYSDQPEICKKYNLFPSLEKWKDKILLLETSEEKPSPEKYEKALLYLKEVGLFKVISGILMGKPYDEVNQNEYEEIIVKVVDNKELPIVSNINIGHSQPRCIIPFGIKAKVDINSQEIIFENK